MWMFTFSQVSTVYAIFQRSSKASTTSKLSWPFAIVLLEEARINEVCDFQEQSAKLMKLVDRCVKLS
jgi:hypothetical protein